MYKFGLAVLILAVAALAGAFIYFMPIDSPPIAPTELPAVRESYHLQLDDRPRCTTDCTHQTYHDQLTSPTPTP